MFTVCPKCTLTLAVTANDLRVGQGYVRCGRCSNVFNALLKLSEAPDGEGESESEGGGGPTIAQANPASNSQITRAISSEAASAAVAAPPSRDAPAGSTAPPPGMRSAPAAAPSTASSQAAASAARIAGAAVTSGIPSAGTPLRRSTDASVAQDATPNAGAHLAQAALRASTAAAPTPAVRASQASVSAQSPRAAAAPAAAAPAAAGTLQRAQAPPAPPTPRAAQTQMHQTARAPLPNNNTGARTAASPAPEPRLPQAAQPSASAPSAFAAPSAASHTDEEAIDQFELVLKTLGLSLDEHEPPLRPSASTTGEPSDSDADGPTRVVENIVLEGDGISQSQAEVSDKPLDELDQFTRRLSRASAAGELPAARAPRAKPHDIDEITFEEDAAPDDASLDDPLLDEPLPAESVEALQAAPAGTDLDIPALEPTPYRWAWIGGSFALALLLVLQMVGHWRERLALSPTWGGAVRALSAAVGAPISPHWDLTAYEVRQQGAEFEPGKRAQILVRFSLANHAARAQPVPLLRLTLLDRYGRRVAQRDLTPTDYWPQGHAPAAFLNSDQRIDTEVQVRDPSSDSASFELDVCLREARGLLQCAGDANASGSGAGAG